MQDKTAEKIQIKWPKIRPIVIIGSVILLIVIPLLTIHFPGKLPLHNPPDRIQVYQYGREAAYGPEDDEYRQLYKRLRRVGGYRALDVVTGRDFVMFSMQTSGAEEAALAYYLRDGLVVAALYDTVQSAEHDEYRVYVTCWTTRTTKRTRSPRPASTPDRTVC